MAVQPAYQRSSNGIYQDALTLPHKLVAYAYVLLGAVYGLVLGSYEVTQHLVRDLQSREGRKRLLHGDPLYSTGQTKLLSQQPAGKGATGVGVDAGYIDIAPKHSGSAAAATPTVNGTSSHKDAYTSSTSSYTNSNSQGLSDGKPSYTSHSSAHYSSTTPAEAIKEDKSQTNKALIDSAYEQPATGTTATGTAATEEDNDEDDEEGTEGDTPSEEASTPRSGGTPASTGIGAGTGASTTSTLTAPGSEGKKKKRGKVRTALKKPFKAIANAVTGDS